MAERSRRGRWVRRPGWGALVVLAATGTAMVWAYLRAHQIYPDTQLYLGWTYRFMGYDPATAERLVFDYIRANAVFEPYDSLWKQSVLTLMYRPRVLLPVLSIPFVKLFGPGGIVVVPGIAFVAAMYLSYRFATIHASVRASVAACVLALLSPLVVVWNVGGLTDSLGLMLHAATLLLLPWRGPTTWRRLLAVAAICAVAATARSITPFTAAALAGLWLWAMWRGDGKLRRSWTAATAAAAAGSLVGLVWIRVASAPLTTKSLFTAGTGGDVTHYQDLLPWYVRHLPGRIATEIGLILDSPPLALLIVLSLLACVTAWRSVVPWLVLPAWLGALGIFMINPVATAFRYELPVLPALIAAVAVLIDQAAGRAALAPQSRASLATRNR